MFTQLKQNHIARKKIRKLRELRTCLSPAGYSLKQFDDHQCVFIHIPKCAGVSVAQSLFGNQGAGHHSASTMRQVLGNETYNQYFTFSIVRNPWDRLVSAFHFLKRGGFNDIDRRWASTNLQPYDDFNIFVKDWVTPDHVRNWIHFQPQCDFICTENGALDIDFVGRFEQLDKDFQILCKNLNLKRTLASLNQNQSTHSDYKRFYDDQAQGIVSQVYADDIKLLNYSF